ncbi:MAG TPA: GNAT family N-acetyltransferase [Rhizobacter sp.]|nr:GNAT family N-acetyltransferase [Rhizobacter sp.]
MVDEALLYRPATVADAEVLGRLNHQLIRDEGHRNPMSEAELIERMRGWLSHDGYEALLGFDGDTPVAYVLWRDQPDCVYLRQIYVQRDYRRQGAARHLMLSVFERWPDKRLVVDVLAGNARALAFWRRMGYQDYAVMLERLPLRSE